MKKHKLYTRSGADLILEKEITLKQALLGFNFTLKGLDGKDFTVSSIAGEVLQDGCIKSCKGKGLPFYRDAMSHGNLIIKFKVKFPRGSDLTDDIKAALEKVLPGPKTGPAAKGQAEFMKEFTQEDLNSDPKGGQRGHHHDDDDDDDAHHHGRHQQRAECGMQ